MLTAHVERGIAVGVVYFCKLSAGLWCCSKVANALHADGFVLSGPPPESGIILVCRITGGSVNVSVIAVDKRGDPASWLPPAFATGHRTTMTLHGQSLRIADHSLAECKKALLQSLRGSPM